MTRPDAATEALAEAMRREVRRIEASDLPERDPTLWVSPNEYLIRQQRGENMRYYRIQQPMPARYVIRKARKSG